LHSSAKDATKRKNKIRRVNKPLREAGVRMVDFDAFFW
jgi:hypothetical protein